jgi:hypothetical protein
METTAASGKESEMLLTMLENPYTLSHRELVAARSDAIYWARHIRDLLKNEGDLPREVVEVISRWREGFKKDVGKINAVLEDRAGPFFP